MAETRMTKKRVAKKHDVPRDVKPNEPRTPLTKTPARRGPLAPERVAAILNGLDEAYPDAVCALAHRTPWELLVATILSAQCTDVRVNMVTPELFRRFPTPEQWPRRVCPSLRN